MVLRLGLFALVLFISSVLLGCAAIPLSSKYTAPKERPITLDQYYSKGKSYLGYKEEVLQKNKNKEVTQKTITINTQYGDILVDYYDHKSNDDDLIFVFPLLGGKPIVSQHFAKYFSDRGIDSAILRRNDDFKNPAFFNKIEKMLRENVVRDRIAIDFFEKVYHKKDFAGFGVSRGAINLAMTAGADPRLKYSVMAMGATDLPLIFIKSNQKRLQKYIVSVMAEQNMTRPQLLTFLETALKTDPKNLARYINAKDSLLFLSVFDKTVPFEYGRRLRKEIGNPRTIFLLSNHYTIAMYTQLFTILPPGKDGGILPFDYLELESIDFFRKKFKLKEITYRLYLFNILRAPFDLIGTALEKIF